LMRWSLRFQIALRFIHWHFVNQKSNW
jgi:hypothetical protein